MDAIIHKQIITWILEYSCAHDLDELTQLLHRLFGKISDDDGAKISLFEETRIRMALAGMKGVNLGAPLESLVQSLSYLKLLVSLTMDLSAFTLPEAIEVIRQFKAIILMRAVQDHVLDQFLDETLTDEDEDEDNPEENLQIINDRLKDVNDELDELFRPIIQTTKRQANLNTAAIERLSSQFSEDEFSTLFDEFLHKIDASLPTPYLERLASVSSIMVFPGDVLTLKSMTPVRLLEIYKLQDPSVRDFLRAQGIVCRATQQASGSRFSFTRNGEDGEEGESQIKRESTNSGSEDESAPSSSSSTPVGKKRLTRDFLTNSAHELPAKLSRAESLDTPPKRGELTRIGQRARVKWTEHEIENLVMGVKQCGEGHWKEIMAKYKFVDRTNIDLKDKWRNLTRRFRAEELFARVS